MSKIERIYHGDSIDVLKTFESNSIDSVCCDPPYGLSKEPDINEVLTKWLAGEEYDHGHGGFMGKSWDSFVPHPDIWREVYRVLKPGGHALVFAGTRTQDLMTISLRLAGFEVRDVIEWLYFSGFPKSHDVSKAFDRRNGSSLAFREESERFGAYLKERRKAKGYSMKYIDEQLGLNTSYSWWEGRKSGVQPPSKRNYLRLKPLLEIDDRFDVFIDRVEAEREKVGEYEYKRKGEGTWDEQLPGGLFGAQERTVDITVPATELARKWDGWGTALKPAHEPIIVVRKPLIDADTGRKLTVADCVEKYGTGAINIDASRIGINGATKRSHQAEYAESGWRTGHDIIELDAGRFPANCVTLDSDEFYSKYFNISPAELSKKASKKDRNSDWQGEEIGVPLKEKTFGNDKGDGFGRGLSDSKLPTRNNHPTVKPTDLMAWLVRLVTPAGGTVLDPFAGSGSTLVAAKREGFGFIGIELTEEYIPIIEARTGTKAQATEGQATKQA